MPAVRAARPAVTDSTAVAPDRPVARVAVDVPHAHLDRLFDYLVPAVHDEQAQPGVRVRVRFAGRLVGGFLVARADRSDETGAGRRLARLDKVFPLFPSIEAAQAA